MAGENDQLLNLDFGGSDDDDAGVVVSLPPAEGEVQIRKIEAGDKAKPAATDDPVESLKSQFNAMSQRATAAEQAAIEAQQVAQQASQRAHQLETAVVGGQLDTVVSGIAAAEAEATNAEQSLITAQEQGDFAAVARAQRAIAKAEARILRLTEAKEDLEEQAQRRPAAPDPTRQQPPQRRQAPSDPVEAFIQGNKLTPRSADFIRKHPETASDQKANARMMAAHNLAVADGVEIESDEYFRRIEEGISVTKKAEPQQAAPSVRRPTAPAAPASGGTSGGALNGGGTEVRLTRGEATAATDGTLVWNYDDPSGKNQFKKGDPIGLAEMARRKHHGRKAGLYDRSFTDQ